MSCSLWELDLNTDYMYLNNSTSSHVDRKCRFLALATHRIYVVDNTKRARRCLSQDTNLTDKNRSAMRQSYILRR